LRLFFDKKIYRLGGASSFRELLSEELEEAEEFEETDDFLTLFSSSI